MRSLATAGSEAAARSIEILRCRVEVSAGLELPLRHELWPLKLERSGYVQMAVRQVLPGAAKPWLLEVILSNRYIFVTISNGAMMIQFYGGSLAATSVCPWGPKRQGFVNIL